MIPHIILLPIVNNSFRCIHLLIGTSNKSVLRNSDIAEVAVKVLTKCSQVKGKKYKATFVLVAPSQFLVAPSQFLE